MLPRTTPAARSASSMIQTLAGSLDVRASGGPCSIESKRAHCKMAWTARWPALPRRETKSNW